MKILKFLTCFMFSFLFSLVFNSMDISAVEYDYEAGRIEKKHKDVVVNSFSYDYITKLDYGTIVENGIDLSNETFYSGKSIVIEYDHYDSWWPFTEDDDSTRIYKYNSMESDFGTSLAVLDNKKGSYTLDAEGVYKVVYRFDGKDLFIHYIIISKDLHDAFIKGDSRYLNTSAYSKFSFLLKVVDAYDLKNNKYYYAFGNSASNLKFTKFEVFSEEEKINGAVVTSIEKELSVDIKDSDTVNNLKKYLFVKIVTPTGEETLVQTANSYNIASKIGAVVYLIDDNGQIIKDEVSYKKGDKINFKVVVNAPVSYSNLQYSIDGINFLNLSNCDEEIWDFQIGHIVQSNTDFVGNFQLRTKNNTNVVVKNGGINVALNVTSEAKFIVDVHAPVINIMEDGEANGKKIYYLTVSVDEDNVDKFLYYASVCSMSQGDRCVDKFNVSHPLIVNLDGAINPTIKIDEQFGKFNGENLAVFVKVVDKAGNEATFVKWGYVLDNVVVPKGEEDLLFEMKNIESNNVVVGKQLLVNVKGEYKVVAVSYKPEGGTKEACLSISSSQFKCLSVENYDFNSNIHVELVDSFGNVEQYSVNFKYSTVKSGSVIIDNKNFDLYNDRDYEIEFKMYNYMRKDEERTVFNENILNGLLRELNIDKVPSIEDMVVNLVYINGENIIVVKDNIGVDLELPTVSELLERLGNLDEFRLCAVEKCDMEIYLQYSYKVKGVPQTRLVKLNYIDSSSKYIIDGFVYENKVNINEEFIGFEYKYVSSLNNSINEKDIISNKKIIYEDLNGNVSEVASINTSVLGKYTISEFFEYNSANSFPLSYTVEVVDSEAPTIRLNGDKRVTIYVGENFADPSAVARDNYDVSVEIQTKVDPEFNPNKVGTYVISYWCVDSSGNTSEVITRTIIVKEESTVMAYVLSGGIGLVTIGIMAIATIIEVRKEKRRK